MQSITSLLENSSVLTTSTTFSEVPTIISSTTTLLTPTPSILSPNNENSNVVPYIFIGLGSVVGILFLSFVGVGVVKSIKKQRHRQSVNEFVNNSSWEYSHKY